MTATSVRAIPCPCQARPGEPCTPRGDHLARYLRAETAGVISRDCLNAAIATLTVLAPHVVVAATDASADRLDQNGGRHMNNFYAHAQAGEPTVRPNRHEPANPFVVVDFGADWDFTSKDPDWCRRVASAWADAAELLEHAIERGRPHIDAYQANEPTARDAPVAQERSMTPHGLTRSVRREEGNPS